MHLLPEEAFHRAFRGAEFDITEISLCSHILAVGRGLDRYVGIPAFTSRPSATAASISAQTGASEQRKTSKGKTIGIPEYQQTANVWIRGILQDEHGVASTDIKWRSGGIEEPGRDERTALDLSQPIDLQPIPAGRTLSDMLAKGELDGMMTRALPFGSSSTAPECRSSYRRLHVGGGSLLQTIKNLPDHACGRCAQIAGRTISLAAGEHLQGLRQGQGHCP